MRRMYLLVTLVLALLSFLPASSAAAITMISPVGQPMIVKSPQGFRIHPITGEYKYHSGVDLAADYGDPIYAAAAGTVTYAGGISGYGNTCAVVIQ